MKHSTSHPASPSLSSILHLLSSFSSFPLLRINHNRHRPIIRQRHLHVRADRLYDGRFPFFVLANNVNWLITNIPPWTSCTDRFMTPASSLKILNRAIFPLNHSISSAVSASSTASKTSNP
jgi:hypothetical protein